MKSCTCTICAAIAWQSVRVASLRTTGCWLVWNVWISPQCYPTVFCQRICFCQVNAVAYNNSTVFPSNVLESKRICFISWRKLISKIPQQKLSYLVHTLKHWHILTTVRIIFSFITLARNFKYNMNGISCLHFSHRVIYVNTCRHVQ